MNPTISKTNGYRDFLKSIQSSVGYWKNYSLIRFTVSISKLMKSNKISDAKLAERLGLSAQQVSRVLRGNENVTIETMAKFAFALDAVVHIHVAKRGVPVRWVEEDAEETKSAKPEEGR